MREIFDDVKSEPFVVHREGILTCSHCSILSTQRALQLINPIEGKRGHFNVFVL